MPTKPKKTASKGWSIRACWTDIDGQQQKLTKAGFATSHAAKEWALGYESHNSYKTADAHSITVEIFLTRWLKMRKAAKDISINTLRNYKNDAEKMLPFIGNIPLQQLRLDHVQEMLTQIDGSPRTVQMIRNTLSSALSYACRSNILDKNVAALATVPKQSRFVYSTLEPDEALKQLDLLRDKKSVLYLPFALALFSGLRRGEALGLRWADVSMDKKTIRVCNQYTLEAGKPVLKPILKTAGSNQIIPVPDMLIDILNEQKKRQLDSGYIETYVCAKRGRLPSLSGFNARMKDFQEKNGLQVCRFHDLRHTFATRMLDAGVDIRTISDMLRHKTPTLAMQTYLHPGDKIKKDAAVKLNNVFQVKTQKKPIRLRRKLG